MPNSYEFFKPEIKRWFLENIPLDRKILDVGCGSAVYSSLLRSAGYRMDAVEIWEPYLEQFHLRDKYDNIFIGDVLNFDIRLYDVIILGDVLEHIEPEKAIRLIQRIKILNKQCIVAVPYQMEQGEYNGNVYESHLQSDLTYEIMKERYPDLQLLFSNQWYGYYSMKDQRVDRAYVLYATESYIDTVQGCVNSIRAVSNIPIIVYLLNSNKRIDGAIRDNWMGNFENPKQEDYINRENSDIYKLLIERPRIIKNALQKYARTVCYVDADSIATKYVDRIFDYYPEDCSHPYFSEGMYDYLHINERGGAESRDNLSGTLEAPTCELFGINQQVRQKYRQTGYFVAGQNCIDFLSDWYYMCNHPKILQNSQWYAPFHEETVLQALLYKMNIQKGLPYIYCNASLDEIDNIYNKYQFGTTIREWFRLPNSKQELLFLHGEKKLEIMNLMIDKLKNMKEKLKVLFLLPHISTGGCPQFCLKRIEVLQKFTEIEIFVVEYQNYSDDYVVQKNKIKTIVDNFYTLGEDKLELLRIILNNNIDIVHIDEMSERLDNDLMSKLYSKDRNYRIIETCHDISFNPRDKIYHPDAYSFCTPYHLDTFQELPSMRTVIEYPIDDNHINSRKYNSTRKKLGFDSDKWHVLNVGLWTPGKNQHEGLKIAREYPELQFHFVGNQAGNFIDYWKPLMKDIPPNVTIWGERKDTELFYKTCDIFMFNSVNECNPLVLREAISYGLPIIAHNLPQYKGMFDKYIQPIDTDLNTIKRNYKIPTDNTSEVFAANHLTLYEKVMEKEITNYITPSTISINQHFVDQPFLEITGNDQSDFNIKFFDENNICHYEDTIKSNHWIKLNRKWYTKWRTEVWKENKLIYNNVLDYKEKRVFIIFESSSLGDTIAWIPYVEEFRKKHECHVIVCTFKNFLFKNSYSDLEFVEPGTTVENLYGLYRIGWFYDKDKEPELCNTIPLQKTASNILGLEYKEIVPKIDFKPKPRKYKNKYVSIVTNSTMACKFFPKETWQEIIDYLVNTGYHVINISKERNEFKNCYQPIDDSLSNTMNIIYYSEFVITISSGLGWLAWAMNKQTVLLSNFTKNWHEWSTNCIRITNKKVCHGCWNESDTIFSKSDWDWCRYHRDDGRRFECHTSISGKTIINKLKKLI